MIADTPTDPTVGKALDGSIQSWDTRSEQIHGFRAEEIVGKPVRWRCGRDRIS